MPSPVEKAEGLLNERTALAFQRKLLVWYRRHGRNLPWRKATDPYRIFVSEIMLQQTQVVRVVPFYHRFLKRFPTVTALARAPLKEVKKITDPLGYKVRGEWLKSVAQKIVNEYGGQFPKTPEELQSLPGIGRSTAGAMMSFAFQQDAPILEANVIRTLTRFFGLSKDIRRAATKNLLWALSERLIPPGQGPLFNQAIMDLGALVCVPRTPRCLLCPLNDHCRWPHRVAYEIPREELPLAAEERSDYTTDQ